MKKILTTLILAIIGCLNQFQVFADTSITITVVPSDKEEEENPNKGHRIPPRPIYCTIDFDSNTIVSTSSLVNNADEYQISTEEGMCFQIQQSSLELKNNSKKICCLEIIV